MLLIDKASIAASGRWHPAVLQTNLIRCKRTSRLFPTQKRAAGSPERAVALAHADTAQDSLLVGLALPQVLAHDVPTQAEAYDNQLGLRVGLLDVVNHRTKLPGATWKIKDNVKSYLPTVLSFTLQLCALSSAPSPFWLFNNLKILRALIHTHVHVSVLWVLWTLAHACPTDCQR